MDIDQGLIKMYGEYFFERRGEFPDKGLSFPRTGFGFAGQWIERLTRLFVAIPKGITNSQRTGLEKNYLLGHRELVLEIVREVQEKKKGFFFIDALGAIEKTCGLPFPLYIEELKEARPTIASFLMTELLLVWALLEKEGKLLVCVRDDFQRKRFPLPDNLEQKRKAITAIGHHILPALLFIEPRHLDLIPDRFGPLEGIDPSVELFIPLQTAEEILADARVQQRYVVAPEGASVEWRKGGGDLKEMLLKVIDGVAIAKVLTPGGGTLAFLDLETAKGIDFVITRRGPRNPLTLVMASVYHQIVTAKKIRAGKETKLSFPVTRMEMEKPELVEEPIVIYCPIPRKIVISGKVREVKVLPRLPIHHESPMPHRRELKRGEMSADQWQRVGRFGQIIGVDLRPLCQEGSTVVLPREQEWEKWKLRKVIFLVSTVQPQLS